MDQGENEATTLPMLRNEVYQSNPLIEARKNFDSVGMKIFVLGLQGVNPHFSEQDKFFDREFRELFIPADRLAAIFGNTWYLHEMKSVCKKMFNATIEVDYPNGGFALYHLFRKLEYVPTKGLYLWFDDLLKPYVLDLIEAQGYTQINVETIFRLSSSYAIRLLELMLQYQNVREFRLRKEVTRTMKMDELRFMLNVPEGAYSGRLNNFRKFVLDDPIREINERTLYTMNYKTLKKGRNVVGFEFKLNMSRLPTVEAEVQRVPFVNDAIETLKSLGFTEKAARATFGKCLDVEDCFSRINRAQALMDRSKTPIRNKVGFLRRAIEQDWRIHGKRKRKPAALPAENDTPKRTSAPASLADIFAPVLSELSKKKPAPQVEEDTLPEKPNKYNIPSNVMQNLREWITSGTSLKTVDMVLSTYNLTVERFKKEFMK